MGFARNISISVSLHLIFLAVALITGGNSNFRKLNPIIVTLFEDDYVDQKGSESVIRQKNRIQSKEDIRRLQPIADHSEDIRKVESLNSENSDLSKLVGIPVSLPKESSNAGNGDMGSAEFKKTAAIHIETSRSLAFDAGQPVSFHQEKTDYDSEIRKIRKAIEDNLVYPYIAMKKKIEGTVMAEFTINNKGLPENIRITKSSGFDILDAAARNTVVRSSPLPLVKGRIEIPITFRLKKEN